MHINVQGELSNFQETKCFKCFSMDDDKTRRNIGFL